MRRNSKSTDCTAGVDDLLSTIVAKGDARLSVDSRQGIFTLDLEAGSSVIWIGNATFEVRTRDGWETEVRFDLPKLVGEATGPAGFIGRLAADPVGWCERAFEAAGEARLDEWPVRCIRAARTTSQRSATS